MKIIVVASSPSDLEISCLGTILKFVKTKNMVYLLIVPRKSKWSTKTIMQFNESWKKVGISEIFFNYKFNHSVVTQENVNILRSYVESINPELVLFPSSLSKDRHKAVLGRSSILACRGIHNMLMYDSNYDSNFSPSIYSMINNTKIKESSISNKKKIHDGKTVRKILELRKIYSRNIGLKIPVEAFNSTRILLLNNDIF